jgi:leucyl aminopeptidase (aminopeptidase T)
MTMSTKIERFTESLRQSLTKMEGQLERARADLKSVQHDDKLAVAAKLRDARHFVESTREKTKTAGARVQSWLRSQEATGAATIASWREKSEKKKLEAHADRAEEHASAAVVYAEGAMADALAAVFEALEARLASDEVAASTAPSR